MNTVLLVGSGYEDFRRYALTGLASTCDVLLVDTEEPDWQMPFLIAWEIVDDVANASTIFDGRRIDGIVTWYEKSVVVAAELGERLGVATMPTEGARRCRDKAAQREIFAAAGVPSARYRLVNTEAKALEAAGELGFPVVVKPRSRAASVGVQLVRVPDALALAVEHARSSEYSETDGQVLIEEYLTGYEVSVDSWVLDGTVTPLVSALKQAEAPWFEEIGHIAGDVLPPALLREIHDVVRQANLALGVDRVVTHTELKVDTSGPRVVEVNGRLGGDLIPHLGELATPGLSVGAVLGDVACGRTPAAIRAPDRCVGIHFFYPPFDMVFERLEVDPMLTGTPWLIELRQIRDSGDKLLLPPRGYLSRAGYCIVDGRDPAEVQQRLADVVSGVRVLGSEVADRATA